MKNKGVLWIAETAIFIALIVVAQMTTSAFSTLITGSLVNLILIVSVMMCGLSSGIVVALVSPILAKLFGIGPHEFLIPFIMLGNLVLILIWNAMGHKKFLVNRYITRIVTIIAAAGLKCLTLYVGIVLVALPFLLNLPAEKEAVISATFSLPQFFTALIGGALAFCILPLIEKARNKNA